MIKVIIFDMDGVLVEAKSWHYEALNQALKQFGYEIKPEEHRLHYDGLPTSKKLEMLSLKYGLPPESHAEINAIKQNYTMEIIHTRCKPQFLHIHTLLMLKAMKYKLAVASNSIRPTVELMMQKAQLNDYLDYLLSASDVAQSKPHPEMYLKVMNQFEVEPEECLIVEDNPKGIKAAMASGAYVLVVRDTSEVNLKNILARIKEIETNLVTV